MKTIEVKFFPITEREARRMLQCLCGKEKCPTALVCWDCFKHIPNCLKYSGVSFEEWQVRTFKPATAGKGAI